MNPSYVFLPLAIALAVPFVITAVQFAIEVLCSRSDKTSQH